MSITGGLGKPSPGKGLAERGWNSAFPASAPGAVGSGTVPGHCLRSCDGPALGVRLTRVQAAQTRWARIFSLKSASWARSSPVGAVGRTLGIARQGPVWKASECGVGKTHPTWDAPVVRASPTQVGVGGSGGVWA